MAHLFFSYAHADAERIYPIHRKMEAILGRKLWIDRIGLRQGIEWENAIERGIDQSYGVIFAVTETFVTRPFVLQKEIPWAIDNFKERQGPLLFVLRLDNVELPPDLKALPPYQCQIIDAFSPDINLDAICQKLTLPAERDEDQPFFVSWPRLENFKGRDQILDTLHQQLMGGAVGVNSRISAGVYGMGGIGKTQLAVEYAYRYRFYYPAGVYWVNAAADWSQELVALADQLALKPADESDNDRAKQKIIALMHFLKNRAANEDGDALIVMDNVENPTDVTTRQMTNGATMIGNAASFCTQARARLLITTRRQDLPTGLAKIEVNVLDPLDARAVLLDARSKEPDMMSIDNLCKAVGYLPLPLGWFAATLRADPDVTPAYLLTDLRARNIDAVITDMMEAGFALGTPQHYVALTGIAFSQQWEQLKSEESRNILTLAAAFEEAAIIPVQRLRYLSGLPPKVGLKSLFDLAIRALTALSLIEPQEDGKSLRLHPLVREFVRNKVDHQAVLALGTEQFVAAYRTPQIIADEVTTGGFEALVNDLRATYDVLSAPSDSLERLKHIFTLEEPTLSSIPVEMGSIFVIQQLRDRAYHEADEPLVSACDVWLNNKAHINHSGFSRYPQNKALLRILTSTVNGVLCLPDGRFLSWSFENTLRLWSSGGQPLATLEGHTSGVNGALSLPDGRLLSWSDDRTLRLWSSGGQPLATLDGHTGFVRGAVSLSDGRLLSWSDDSTLRLWSNDGQPLATLTGHTDSVNGSLCLPDARLLSWSDDSTLRLWSNDGQPLATLAGNTADVSGVLCLPDGRLLSWSGNKTLDLWSSDGQPLSTLVGHTDRVNGVLCLPDGRLLSWSDDTTLRMWSSDGQPMATLAGHSDWVNGTLCLPDGRLLSWSYDSTLRLWSSVGQPLATLTGHTSWVNGALCLPDGRLLSWSYDSTLRLWSSDGQPLTTFDGHTADVTGALILPDGRLLSWSDDNTLRLWSSARQPLTTFIGHVDIVDGALSLPDGRLLSWSFDNTLRLWSSVGQPLATLTGHTHWVTGALSLPDGRLLSWSYDTTLRMWNSDGQPLATLTGHSDWVNGALRLPDGRLLSWSDDNTLRLWSGNGQPLAILTGHVDIVRGALCLPDGRLLSWSTDQTLRMWSSGGQPLATLTGHTENVRGALCLPDGRILSWSDDDTLRLWSSAGQSLATLAGHATSVNGALSLPDGRLLSWAYDSSLRLWSSTGQPLATLTGHTISVIGALCLPDRRLLSWSADQTLRLWSSGGQPLATLTGHTENVNGALALSDGRLLSWSADRTLRLWSADGTRLLVYFADAPITCCIEHSPGLIVTGDTQGRVLFLRIYD